MADSTIAIKNTLRLEGGLNDDPTDAGGLTKYGVSANFLRSMPGKYCPAGTEEDYIRNHLTLDTAIKIADTYFWPDIYDQINNQDVANYLYDMGYNMGVKQATKIFQRSLFCYSFIGKDAAIKCISDVDGVFGPSTLDLTNKITATSHFLEILKASRLTFHIMDIAAHQAKQGQLNGMINRVFNV